jgi:hypothetical protein
MSEVLEYRLIQIPKEQKEGICKIDDKKPLLCLCTYSEYFENTSIDRSFVREMQTKLLFDSSLQGNRKLIFELKSSPNIVDIILL